MKWFVPFTKMVITNFKRVDTKKAFQNSTVLMTHFRKNLDMNTPKSFLRLRLIGTSTKIEKTRNHILKNKVDRLVKWYEQFTGLDEVRLMQNRVVEAQNRLVEAQENRREATKLLVAVQTKLKDIREELDTTTKGEERYLHLITQEHAILKEEKTLTLKFQLSEKEERDCFAYLSSAVKESHEKERAQAERTKYWSLIGSIIGTIIGVLGSSINNEFKMRELRKLVKLSADDRSESVMKMHQKELVSLVNEIRTVINQKQAAGDMVMNDEIFLHNLNNYQYESGLQKLLEKQSQEVRNSVMIFTGFAIIVPIICAVIQRIT